jgi:hypothetical protein
MLLLFYFYQFAYSRSVLSFAFVMEQREIVLILMHKMAKTSFTGTIYRAILEIWKF